MKKLIIILLLSMIFFTHSQAVEQNLPTQIQSTFETKIKNYYPQFQQSAQGLLYSLGVISLVISFGFMAIRGELEVGGAFAQLIKFALIIGFFSMLISSPSWLKNIYEGFDSLGASAGGDKFDNIINNVIDMWKKILNKLSIWEPGEAIGFFIAGIAATYALTVLVGNALMVYGFTVMSIYIGVLWLGFGSFEQTRPWAINAIVNVVRWSTKWMMMLIIISITFTLIDDILNKGFEDFNSIIILFVISMMMVTISNGISAFVDSYFSGMGGGENSRGMQMATALMSGMAAGAAGAAMGVFQGAKGASNTIAAAAATGEEKSTLGKAASYFSGMASGAAKGAMHGGGNFAENWAKTIDPNSTTSSSSSSSGNFAKNASSGASNTTSDGDVGGGLKGSFAEPKVGGEINPNQSDKS